MFILASGSPRRQELLTQAGAGFKVVVSDAAEESDSLPPEKLVEVNAIAKARAVAEKYPDMAVLGADTVVALAGHTYGKPNDARMACKMLALLAGKTHQVLTGIAFINQGRVYTDVVTTEVAFSPMSAAEIEGYAATGEPLDKAGAYAVQGRAAVFISKINGSYSNVVGLPLFATRRLARKAGVEFYDNHGERSSVG